MLMQLCDAKISAIELIYFGSGFNKKITAVFKKFIPNYPRSISRTDKLSDISLLNEKANLLQNQDNFVILKVLKYKAQIFSNTNQKLFARSVFAEYDVGYFTKKK